MAFDFPPNPVNGQKYTSGSSTYMWNGYGWMSEPPTAYVKIKGDTMTGALTIRQPGSTGHLILDNSTATDSVPIVMTKNDKKRWTAGVGPGPEPGDDVASDWHFRRYNDAGVLFGDIPLKINRKTGRAQIAFTPVDPMDVANKAFVEAVMGGGGPEHVLRAGDVMTGPLTLPTLVVNAVPGGQADIYGQSSSAARWLIRMTDNFELHRYGDAGNYLGSPFSINRLTGAAGFAHQLSATSMWTPNGYAGSFASDNASIGNCSSGGTFSLNVVNCGALNASSIVDHGTLTTHGASYLNGDVYAANVIEVGGEIRGMSSRPDQQLILRSVYGAGLIRINQWGGVVQDFGFATKPGIYSYARGHYFNIDYIGGSPELWIDNDNFGRIATVSDYRIKREVMPLPSMWAHVKALNPVSYMHKDYTPERPPEDDIPSHAKSFTPPGPLIKGDSIPRWGFIAHELQETLIMDAATGEKDAPNVIQSPNPWTVIAALTKTLQEAMQRIEALEAQR